MDYPSRNREISHWTFTTGTPPTCWTSWTRSNWIACILGCSSGSGVVAAGTQPERFKSVAVWGAVGYFGPEMRPAVQRMYPADWLKPEAMAPHGLSDKDAFVLGWMTAAKHMIDSGGDVSLSLADKITCPALLMLGEHDRLNPVEYGRAFVNRAQNGRLEVFPCGHAVHDEQWDAFRRVVGEFLTSAQP
jgi:pimeloyl-ACP methyl ester carboxylesterase